MTKILLKEYSPTPERVHTTGSMEYGIWYKGYFKTGTNVFTEGLFIKGTNDFLTILNTNGIDTIKEEEITKIVVTKVNGITISYD